MSTEENSGTVTIWQALRDIGVACVNKDQFYPFAITVVILGIFFLLPATDRIQLIFKILDGFNKGYLWGWGVSLLICALWKIQFSRQKKNDQNEISRLSGERTKLQERGLGNLLESSTSLNSPDDERSNEESPVRTKTPQV